MFFKIFSITNYDNSLFTGRYNFSVSHVIQNSVSSMGRKCVAVADGGNDRLGVILPFDTNFLPFLFGLFFSDNFSIKFKFLQDHK